jgi:hypothetical protein
LLHVYASVQLVVRALLLRRGYLFLEPLIGAVGYMIGRGIGACRIVVDSAGGEMASGSRRVGYGRLFQFPASGARLGIFACFWVAWLVPGAGRCLRAVGHDACKAGG